jgi:hypothetical protein
MSNNLSLQSKIKNALARYISPSIINLLTAEIIDAVWNHKKHVIDGVALSDREYIAMLERECKALKTALGAIDGVPTPESINRELETIEAVMNRHFKCQNKINSELNDRLQALEKAVNYFNYFKKSN